ncbi:MAG: antitoxin VapB family protein [Candidatus Woesearchaeota archaeon]
MTKIISIADDAYEYLSSLKEEKESFSKVIRRLKPKSDQRDLLKLAGVLKDDDPYVKAMEGIIKSRENIKFKTPRFD